MMFALRKFRNYLLLSKPFTVLTDQLSLRAAFARKNIHILLARWLDFSAEYDFEIRCRSGDKNKAVDFLLQGSHGETGADEIEEGDMVSMIVVDSAVESMISQLKPALHDIVGHLSCSSLKNKSSREK